MDQKLLKKYDVIKNNQEIFFNYLRAKFPLFHNSNFFFRDLQYGIKRFLEKKDIKVTSPEAEILTKKIAEYYEELGIFVQVNDNVWKINLPEYVTTEPGDPL